MIFVSTGTVSFPFKRLVDEIQNIFETSKEKVLIQAGSYKTTPNSPNIKLVQYMSFDETIQTYKNARINVSACGEASASLLIQYSKNIPVFVPRIRKFNEHVDNQQELIARYIQKNDLGTVVFDIKKLLKKVTKPTQINLYRSRDVAGINTGHLISRLDTFTKESG